MALFGWVGSAVYWVLSLFYRTIGPVPCTMLFTGLALYVVHNGVNAYAWLRRYFKLDKRRKSLRHKPNKFKVGDIVEVYSTSQGAWFPNGLVDRVISSACNTSEYLPGSIHVTYGNDLEKWIRPTDIYQQLRHVVKDPGIYNTCKKPTLPFNNSKFTPFQGPKLRSATGSLISSGGFPIATPINKIRRSFTGSGGARRQVENGGLPKIIESSRMQKVKALMDMGHSESLATSALQQCNWDTMNALNFLSQKAKSMRQYSALANPATPFTRIDQTPIHQRLATVSSPHPSRYIPGQQVECEYQTNFWKDAVILKIFAGRYTVRYTGGFEENITDLRKIRLPGSSGTQPKALDFNGGSNLMGDDATQTRIIQEYFARIKTILEKHNPSKLHKIDKIMSQNRGKEHLLYIRICKKYNIVVMPEYTGGECSRGCQILMHGTNRSIIEREQDRFNLISGLSIEPSIQIINAEPYDENSIKLTLEKPISQHQLITLNNYIQEKLAATFSVGGAKHRGGVYGSPGPLQAQHPNVQHMNTHDPTLPHGWARQWSESEKAYYYHNRFTNANVWTRPTN